MLAARGKGGSDDSSGGGNRCERARAPARDGETSCVRASLIAELSRVGVIVPRRSVVRNSSSRPLMTLVFVAQTIEGKEDTEEEGNVHSSLER